MEGMGGGGELPELEEESYPRRSGREGGGDGMGKGASLEVSGEGRVTRGV